MRLHKETETALQILLFNLSIKPGKYEADDYDINWKRIK
jgi:hypothetical protein